MSLSSISIHRPVFAWMLMAALIIFGGISFMSMGISQLPDVDFPVVNVSLTVEGAAPEVMETDVVDVVEDAVMGIQGVRNVTSASRTGQANVTVEFELGRNIDDAVQDVQTKIAQAQRNLPRELDPPVITKTNPDDQPILWIALRSDTLPLRDLTLYIRDVLKGQFATVPGVGDIQLGGYVEPNLRIWVRPKDLYKYALTVTDVINTIQQEHAEPPSGVIQSGPKEFSVRTLGEAENVSQFEHLFINSRGGLPNFAPIRLGDVARVEAGLEDIRTMSRLNGKPAVALGIQKQRGANAVAVADAVKGKLDQIRKELPKGTQLELAFDGTRFIRESVGELVMTLALAAILTSVVCWLFLGSWSATLNVLLAIPTSVVGAFIILSFAGFTLNTFTLLALSLSIGIVVDDAIMVLENIIRHREHGQGKIQAALDGSREITFAAVAATVSILAIFLPVAFMKGIIGRFFFQFGVTMAVAVLLSLLEALTLTPMRCAQFVSTTGERRTRIGRAIENSLNAVTRGYGRALGATLRYRWIVLGTALVFFAISFLTVSRLNKEFIPAEDQSQFLIRAETPIGSSIDFTSDRFRLIEKFLSSRPEIQSYYVALGGFTGGEVNTGFAFVTMKPKGQRGTDPESHHELDQQEMMSLARREINKIPGVEARLQDLSARGFTASRGFPIEFSVQGSDWDKLASYTQEIMKRLGQSGLVTDIDTDYKLGVPEIRINPDRQNASARGVAVATIGQTINAMVGSALIGKYPEAGHRYDIRVKTEKSDIPPVKLIRSLNVRNNRGELIPLSDVVKIEQKPSLQVISRRNRQRAVTVYGNVAPGASQQAALQKVEEISKQVLPQGYRIELSGSAETFRESFNSLIFALVIGLAIAYMILASQFNSFVDPMSVLAALPFSVSGAFIALLIAKQSLNIYSMIGLILLMGIVKKNSILLVDFTNQVRDQEHLGIREALVRACPTRLRPILMTSIATVAGAIPGALALGPGAESRIPMSVAVIGGVSVSTLLTLFVVPALYSLITRRHRRTIDQELEEENRPHLKAG